MNLAICSNGGTNAAFNLTSSTGTRTVKNFTISASILPMCYKANRDSANFAEPLNVAYALNISDTDLVNEALNAVPVRWAIIYCP